MSANVDTVTTTKEFAHFCIDAATFKTALAQACRIIPKRNNYGVQIFNNVRLVTSDAGLNIVAFDLETEITANIPAEVIAPGGFTIGAHALMALIKTCAKNSQVKFEASERLYPQQNIVTIHIGSASYVLETLPESDYPALVCSGPSRNFQILAQSLLRIFDQTAFAISTEETRYYLNGVCLLTKMTPHGSWLLRAVATDGHRLAICDTPQPISGAYVSPEIIIPRLTVDALQRRLKSDLGFVTVTVYASQISFALGRDVIHAKLIDGAFPDYERVIPQNYDKSLIVSREEMLAAIKAVIPVLSANHPAIKLTIMPSDLTLSVAKMNGDGDAASLGVPCDWNGEESFEIGFNYKYLSNILMKCDSPKVTICLSDTSSPIKIRDADTTFILMPMRV